MISRWIVHFECHWGYRPRFSIRRAPRVGDRVVDGGEAGVLVACRDCSGVGFFNRLDTAPAPGARGQAENETEEQGHGL